MHPDAAGSAKAPRWVPLARRPLVWGSRFYGASESALTQASLGHPTRVLESVAGALVGQQLQFLLLEQNN